MIDREEFIELLEDLVSSVFGPVKAMDRISEKGILEAEDRVKLKLPSILLEYYRFVGNHPQVSEGMNHLLKPPALYLRNGGLIFQEENQKYYFCGILAVDVSKSDPPVMQGNCGETTWYPEGTQLSSHLLASICWQACNALPALAHVSVSTEQMSLLKKGLRSSNFGAELEGDTTGLWGDGVAVAAFAKGDAYDVYLAARTKELLDDFRIRFGISAIG